MSYGNQLLDDLSESVLIKYNFMLLIESSQNINQFEEYTPIINSYATR